MQNDNTFPATRQDIENLKRTATDAAADLKSTAAVHLDKAKSQLSDLSDHAQEEGRDQWSQVRGSFEDVVNSGRDYVSAKPLASLAIVLGVGVVIGFVFRGSSRE